MYTKKAEFLALSVFRRGTRYDLSSAASSACNSGTAQSDRPPGSIGASQTGHANGPGHGPDWRCDCGNPKPGDARKGKTSQVRLKKVAQANTQNKQHESPSTRSPRSSRSEVLLAGCNEVEPVGLLFGMARLRVTFSFYKWAFSRSIHMPPGESMVQYHCKALCVLIY